MPGYKPRKSSPVDEMVLFVHAGPRRCEVCGSVPLTKRVRVVVNKKESMRFLCMPCALVLAKDVNEVKRRGKHVKLAFPTNSKSAYPTGLLRRVIEWMLRQGWGAEVILDAIADQTDGLRYEFTDKHEAFDLAMNDGWKPTKEQKKAVHALYESATLCETVTEQIEDELR
jgi:hypothetical protein